MNKRIVVVIPAVLLAASAYPQTTDLFGAVITGTPQDVQAAIDKGADVNARDKDGKTALMGAVNNFDSSVVRVAPGG